MTILLFIKPPACLAPNILLDSCRDRTAPPGHDHRHKTTARTALLLILGSSPMVEGIPAFFAAGKYGIGLIVAGVACPRAEC